LVPTKQCAKNVRINATIIAFMEMVKKKRSAAQLIRKTVFAKNVNITGIST
jgi:hypothetical protein